MNGRMRESEHHANVESLNGLKKKVFFCFILSLHLPHYGAAAIYERKSKYSPPLWNFNDVIYVYEI